MAFQSEPSTCGCGHEVALHDGNGCAAFLGAFVETAGVDRYCRCRTARNGTIRLPILAKPHGGDAIVASVRIRERPGSAIGVCESPPALELAPSADLVIARVKKRLRTAVQPSPDGAPQLVRFVREDAGETRIEALR
jgi:hypothetical protein